MTKVYNKLVRDKIPDIIQEGGGIPSTRILDDETYRQELINKLDEEVVEFKADLSVEEPADVQEVVLALGGLIAGREKFELLRADRVAEQESGAAIRLHELVAELEEKAAMFRAECALGTLVNVQEVVVALAGVIASGEELEAVRIQKAVERGAFEERIFLEEVV